MKIDILTFCDFASLYGGKLCIVGASDMIGVRGIPSRAGGFIVIKLQIHHDDVGNHIITASIIDADGKALVNVKSDIKVDKFEADPNKHQLKTHFCLHAVQFQIQKFGSHSIEVSVDGNSVHSVPIGFFVLPQKRA
jgi:hypothetical protein